MVKFEFKTIDKVNRLVMTLTKEETSELDKIYRDHKEEIYGSMGLGYIFMDYKDVCMFNTEPTYPKRH